MKDYIRMRSQTVIKLGSIEYAGLLYKERNVQERYIYLDILGTWDQDGTEINLACLHFAKGGICFH